MLRLVLSFMRDSRVVDRCFKTASDLLRVLRNVLVLGAVVWLFGHVVENFLCILLGDVEGVCEDED